MSLLVKETSKCRGKINTFFFTHWMKEAMCRSEHWLKPNCLSCLSLFIYIAKLQKCQSLLPPPFAEVSHSAIKWLDVGASESPRMDLPAPLSLGMSADMKSHLFACRNVSSREACKPGLCQSPVPPAPLCP